MKVYENMSAMQVYMLSATFASTLSLPLTCLWFYSCAALQNTALYRALKMQHSQMDSMPILNGALNLKSNQFVF